MYTLTKSLDSTRLVIDNDGWEHTDLTDLFAIHDYARNGDLLRDKYKDLGKPNTGVPNNARSALAPGFKYNGAPVVLSEFGGISYIMPGQQAPEGPGDTQAWSRSECGVRAAQRPVVRYSRHTSLRGYLLYAAHRCRTGDQRIDDIRSQAEVQR